MAPYYYPVQVAGVSSAQSVSAGYNFSVALKSDGTVWAWGNNSYGQLGDGTTVARTLPVQVIRLTKATFISAGRYDSSAILAGGTVITWGANDYGQIGNGTTTNNAQPVTVTGVSGAIAVGTGYNTAVVTSQGVCSPGD
jgi:alpha-tubulin suppressor-like RCC1 family protein